MTPPDSTFKFEAIGTGWTIDLYGDFNSDRLRQLEQLVRDRIEEFDKTYSRFRKDSLVTKISTAAGTYNFPEDAKQLFDIYQRLYDVTTGKVTPLIGDLMIQAGYDAEYSLKPADTLTPARAWQGTLLYEHPALVTTVPVMLDFGAAGKGYLVDIVGNLLAQEGVNSFVIDAGGDIVRHSPGQETMRVGLENPADTTQAIGVAQLGNGSICCSGTYRRMWAGLHHVMDPDKAAPTQSIIATWVMADTAIVADGIATALFFTNPEKLRKAFDFEYCILYADFGCHISKGFPGEVFTNPISQTTSDIANKA